MSTAQQQQAARANGAKSIGPVTAEGKARSSQNATKHGLSGGPVVLPHESHEEFDSLKLSYCRQYRPATQSERDLVDEMVEARWRMRRLILIETALMNDAFERQLEQLGEHADNDRAMALGFVEIANQSKGWRLVERYQRTLRRGYERAMMELKESQENRAAVPEEHIEAQEEHIEQEPGRPADYSCLTPANTANTSPNLMKTILPYLHKQNQIPADKPAHAPAA